MRASSRTGTNRPGARVPDVSALTPGAPVLFIGDSITDAGRDRSNPFDLGGGYPALVAATYAATSTAAPESGVRFLNRGISGNRVRDLRRRWQADCLDLAPQLVSIMIGVNDMWRRYDADDPTPVEDFERDYRAILRATVDGGAPRLVLVEPFLLPVREEQRAWRGDLDPKIGVVRRLADEFAATLVPLDTLLAEATATRAAAELAGDGVHPTPDGHALIARHWCEAVDTVGATEPR